MSRNVGRVVSHGIVRAISKKLSLGLAGVTATGALLLQSWEMFTASMIGYFALVAWDLGRARFWQQTLREVRRRPPELPNALDFRDDVARDFVHRMISARAERGRVLETQPNLPDRVGGQLEQLVVLEARAIALVGRMEELSRFLSEKNLPGLREDRLRLERAAESAPTAVLRAEYRKACVALDEELCAVHEIANARDFIAAKLEVAVRTQEMFPAQLARLRALEDQGLAGDDSGELDPRSLIMDLRAVDELLANPEPVARLERDRAQRQDRPRRLALRSTA